MLVFTIYDQAAEAFNTPFCLGTEAEAKRSFVRMAKDPNSLVSFSPGDFALFELGEFDQKAGTIQLHEAPRLCMTGITANSETTRSSSLEEVTHG